MPEATIDRNNEDDGFKLPNPEEPPTGRQLRTSKKRKSRRSRRTFCSPRDRVQPVDAVPTRRPRPCGHVLPSALHEAAAVLPETPDLLNKSYSLMSSTAGFEDVKY
jgi:hypothetical protein